MYRLKINIVISKKHFNLIIRAVRTDEIIRMQLVQLFHRKFRYYM